MLLVASAEGFALPLAATPRGLRGLRELRAAAVAGSFAVRARELLPLVVLQIDAEAGRSFVAIARGQDAGRVDAEELRAEEPEHGNVAAAVIAEREAVPEFGGAEVE